MPDLSGVERYKLEQLRNSGANWFYWIAALSVVNTVLFLTETQFNFIFGLAVTQLIDGFVSSFSPFVRGAGAALGILIAGAFAGLGWLARRHEWAFVTGIVVYGADTLIFLFVGEWIGLAFHVFALWAIRTGLVAAEKLAELPAATDIAQTSVAAESQAPAV